MLPMKREQVLSLVRELRFPMPHGVVKKKKGLGGRRGGWGGGVGVEIMQHLFKKKKSPTNYSRSEYRG